ncbi:ATP phosphoribosyltransferase regulatory subunit [Leptothermofonsia sichuanensis E412]|uniref:ATP phosphoribosyltransferase regulatory subunit n=1 Tax=Leptothermofonsia sichuanensis TaxID=2917832 RepID=UPI001CA6B455|nr:ATP phosphoribosyltransferase regulatory subunit [Leptothermofonsia sichuanensis]QZZ21141.1 ATP phosphoribosyltransferase regulatory subunit [Leptothermofonsia sichuanensis E412]
MVYQSPAGARDLLPLDVTQKRWIEERLQQVFHHWGYHRIITSTLERMDTLMAGGAIQRSTVIQLQESEDEALGLRPELTASIARAAVTRMAGSTLPLRLYYNANVFRRAQEGSHSRQQEFYQAGVELLGAGGLLADAEALLLLVDCLNALGLQDWTCVLGEAGLTRSLLALFPLALRDQVRWAIAHLDRITLESLPLTPELRTQALMLLDLRGHPADVLQRVASLKLDAYQRKALDNLKSLVELLEESQASPFPLVLDLSLIRTFDYYTGIVFEVVNPSNAGLQVLGQGGRYDQLLGLYHPQGQSYPGIGFSLQIEQLHQVLLSTGQLPAQTPDSEWLVVPDSPRAYTAALAHAQTLRNAVPPAKVELELGGRTPAEIYDYARHRQIAQIAWVKAEGKIVIETVNNQS